MQDDDEDEDEDEDLSSDSSSDEVEEADKDAMRDEAKLSVIGRGSDQGQIGLQTADAAMADGNAASVGAAVDGTELSGSYMPEEQGTLL